MLIKLFYLLKPFISRKLQFTIRRLIVSCKLKKYRTVWPINEAAGKKPEWFSGWPQGKQFALLVTHDVEQEEGLDKIKKVIEIDEKYGIASAFGLIPERYTVTPEMLDLLRAHKCGIFVHDLNHDGRLFSNYTTFHQRVPKINRYLRLWKVDGFRAGAMHHNLDWIGELDISYDMSTFDTDPFEPMPDGANTIFPFVATSTSTNRCYIEIPYTLPQDLMTLVLHPAKSIEIWKTKLDWIAQQEGMVLLNVHPDYMAFSDEENSFDNYPAARYEEFLAYVNEQYKGAFWNPSPSELSKFSYNAAKVCSPTLL